MSIVLGVKKAIVSGDVKVAVQKAEAAIRRGLSAAEVLNHSVVPAINEIRARWADGRYFIPDVILGAEAAKEATRLLRSHLQNQALNKGRFVIGTVRGDLHDLGKNIVACLLEGAGFDVSDLGVDVSAETFVQKVEELSPNILGVGAYLSSTAPNIRDLVRALENKGLRAKVKLMVGGIAVTPKLAAEVGADAYGKDALDAVIKANRLMEEHNYGAGCQRPTGAHRCPVQ